MQTGENDQGLRKIIDFTRAASIALLLIHFYYEAYALFAGAGLQSGITDRLIANIARTEILQPTKIKLASFIALIISLIGAQGKKSQNIHLKKIAAATTIAAIAFFASTVFLPLNPSPRPFVYIALTSISYLVILAAGTQLSRHLKKPKDDDIFNSENETFPQQEKKLENEYSINLPAIYNYKKQNRKSWINIINPFRGTLIIGSPGAGKSYFIIRHIITQHIAKGFTMFIYDFKYDDLTKIAYNAYLQNQNTNQHKTKFYTIQFDDPAKSHRCNPLHPESMRDITDAAESAQVILLGLNREWIRKKGDFFVESPINFVTAVIWFLKKFDNGKYCTLPHAIELLQAPYDELFSILRTEPEIEPYINPFISAYQNNATDQLEGQVGSAKIALARLSSPQLYYVLSGNDFTLDINSPDDPKILCMGNNPQKQQIYGSVISLYITRMLRLVNQKNKRKCSVLFDEFPTVYFNGMDTLMATARSNRVAATLAVQDHSQLRKDYGRELADVIMNIAGNIFSGQVSGDTAKQLAERLGRIVQHRTSTSINSSDTSISRSSHLDYAVPAGKIAALSSGEFVGMMADDPATPIELKVFHARIQNDHDRIRLEESRYLELPLVRMVSRKDIADNYDCIKKDVENIIALTLQRIADTPTLTALNKQY